MKRVFVFALLLALSSMPLWSQEPQQNQSQQDQPDQAQSQQTQPQTTQPAQPDQTPTDQPPQPAKSSAQQNQSSQSTDQDQTQPLTPAQQQAQAAEDRQWRAEMKSKATDRLSSSADTMNMVLTGNFLGKGLVDNAKCVIVIPSVKRVGFIFGVEYGRGTMSCRLGTDFKGPFSAPSMIALEGGTFGLQIGVQVSDLVLLVMNERGVNSLLGSKSKLGVDASVAAGPFGRSATAATDMGMKADILAFSRTGGAYLGAVLNGSSLRPDNDGNTALYNRELPSKYIVRSGEVPVPPSGRRFVNILDETTVVAKAAPAKKP